MLSEVAFGEWTPDLAPSHDPHLVVAKNVRAIANGYAPVGQFQAITPTLDAAFLGGGSFASSTGAYTLLAGTAAKLRKYDTTWSDVLTGLSVSQRWNFAQFGDNVVYANGGQLGRYQLIPATAAVIAGAPTNAIDVATVRDFVVALLGDSQVKWSGFNNVTQWTAGSNQCDFQPLLDGGPGVRIVGGEYGIILQKNAIRRMTYVGSPVIFQFDVISAELGCMAAGSVCNVGRLIGFLSERGFEICDGQTVTPISDEKFNRWFFGRFSRTDIAQMWSAIDPRRSLLLWAMPGTPGLIVAYNWVLKRASYYEVDVKGMFTGLTAAVSIDGVDAIYGNLDATPISLDDPTLSGGNPILMLVDATNKIGALSGANLAATIGQNNVELSPARRSRVRNLRPVTDATSASATVSSKMRAGDGESVDVTSTMRGNGKMPLRANGRYLDVALTIPAGESWSYITGCEFEFEPGDGR